MKKSILKKLSLLTVFLLLFTLLFACTPVPVPEDPGNTDTVTAPDPDGSYTSAEDVSAYLIAYGRLPENFITKKKARDLGWEGGSLEPYAPGMCIGGDKFGNYE